MEHRVDVTAPAIRTVGDLAAVMGLTELDDLRLLHDLAKQATVGPAALCTQFHLVKRLRAEGPLWPDPFPSIDDPSNPWSFASLPAEQCGTYTERHGL